MKHANGFTLIELMVVIAIIGILAAIAVPKMFGMSGKARASEVMVQAGAYKKLQETYVMDQGGLGASASIGFAPVQTVIFEHIMDATDPFAFHSRLLTGKSLSSICTEGLGWNLAGTISASGLAWVATGDAGCISLTPSFQGLSSN